MTYRHKLLLTTLSLGWLVPLSAVAQDPEPTKKQPNVLLLVDTSGSMEYKSGQSTYPTCDPTNSFTSERSRWIDVIEVLSGGINDYRCEAVDRRSSLFKNEFSLPGNIEPPDTDYRNPYHRPYSGDCTISPSTELPPANPFDWYAPRYRASSGLHVPCLGSFTQAPDGLIDSFGDIVRFGLMTFDTLPDAGQGYTSSFGYDYENGASGAWSYFVGSPASGHPVYCPTSQTLEVGVRNGAAPPWEGKMIAFGNPNASTTENQNRHSRIEQVLLATRPYGATPIAGSLHDARDYFWYDDSVDPLNPLLKYAPNGGTDPILDGDPYVKAGCRDQYIILLTDGEPNLDLRPYCEQVVASGGDPSLNGKCPFDTPEEIVFDLATATTKPPVKTFVVGFAAETTTSGLDCADLSDDDLNAPSGACSTQLGDQKLQVCCKLHRIAYNGGTKQAYFASNKSTLRAELSKIFGQLSLEQVLSATQPVRSPGIGAADDSGAIAYRILTSYLPTSRGLWRGNVERLRWTCDEKQLPKEQSYEAGEGDSISLNVNTTPSDRTFITFQASESSNTIHSERSIRPNYTANNDGVGTITGTQVQGVGSSLASAIDARALSPDSTLGSACEGLDATTCSHRVMTWALGFDNGTENHRCHSPGDLNCSVIGDIMHSTPVIVNKPEAGVPDESYDAFAIQKGGRPMMIYTSSNDGFLHGFQLSPNRTEDKLGSPTQNNERFAFLPPAVLPLLQSQYPGARQKLLDGVPVVLDVAATADASNSHYKFKLERTGDAAAGNTSTWRTVLVQSFGGAHGGYFALDITDPVPSSDGSSGPKFLWQLTTDENGNPLFGQSGVTPLITTLYFGGKEVAVAVLPGGYGGTPLPDACARRTDVSSLTSINSEYTPRTHVRCYAYDPTNNGGAPPSGQAYAGARSLTIVRLDSGEIIRTFRRAKEEIPNLSQGVFGAETPLDSPITGVPAAYPTGAGAVADRIFIGDQDGTLWRVDVSSTDPSNWEMDLFFDGFAKSTVPLSTNAAAAIGRPISTAPVLSTDSKGQITVAFSTGDQSLSGQADETQYVWSLLEQRDGSIFRTEVNWYELLLAGKHVLGPLELVGEVLYFSTWAPPDNAEDLVCGEGTSEIWGLHYFNAADPNDRSKGGLPGLRVSADEEVISDDGDGNNGEESAPIGGTAVKNISQPGLVFGVAIEFAPTCVKPETMPNAYVGAGTHTSLSNPSPPQMQLVFQTSAQGNRGSDLGFATGFQSINLDPPANASTIESWAAILD